MPPTAAANTWSRAPNWSKFVKGTLRGSGVGMTYDQQRDVMWLLDRREDHRRARQEDDDPGAKIVAGTAGMARRDKYLRFERGFSIVRAGPHYRANSAMAYLTDDGNAVKSHGAARQLAHRDERTRSPGGLQSMAARDINLGFSRRRRDDPTRALLAGGGVIQLAGAGGKPGRRIAGKTIDVTLGIQTARSRRWRRATRSS